jgi:hypothetical protein
MSNVRQVSFGPFEVAEYFLAGVLAALDEANSDPVTTAYVGVGLASFDDMCGQVIVTPSAIYRSTEFPAEDATLDNCGGATIAVQIDVTVLRCIPTIEATGKVPSSAVISAAHKRILDDSAIVWAAMSEPTPADYEWETALHRQTPISASGGTAGFVDSLVVGVESSKWTVKYG